MNTITICFATMIIFIAIMLFVLLFKKYLFSKNFNENNLTLPRKTIHQYRSVYFNIGLATSLGLAYMVFEINTNQPMPKIMDQVETIETIEIAPPPIMPIPKPIPMPESPKSKPNIDKIKIVESLDAPKQIFEDIDMISTDDTAQTIILPKPSPPPPPPPPPLPIHPVDMAPIRIAEQMPRFPGCEEKDMSRVEKRVCAESLLMAYIYNEVRYPSIAREADKKSLAIVQFIVEKDGSISAIKLVRDPGFNMGKEALRAVKKLQSLENWTPGKQNGRPVRVIYNLPVKFKLK